MHTGPRLNAQLYYDEDSLRAESADAGDSTERSFEGSFVLDKVRYGEPIDVVEALADSFDKVVSSPVPCLSYFGAEDSPSRAAETAQQLPPPKRRSPFGKHRHAARVQPSSSAPDNHTPQPSRPYSSGKSRPLDSHGRLRPGSAPDLHDGPGPEADTRRAFETHRIRMWHQTQPTYRDLHMEDVGSPQGLQPYGLVQRTVDQ